MAKRKRIRYTIFPVKDFHAQGAPTTIVRGETVMERGRIVGREGHGRYLRRRIGAAPVPEKG